METLDKFSLADPSFFTAATWAGVSGSVAVMVWFICLRSQAATFPAGANTLPTWRIVAQRVRQAPRLLAAVSFLAFSIGVGSDHWWSVTHAHVAIDRDDFVVSAHTAVRFPLDRLMRKRAIHLPLDEGARYWPIQRLHAVHLPGFWSGWYRLQNGITAYVHMSDPARAVMIPTLDAYVIIVSPEDPQSFIHALMSAE